MRWSPRTSWRSARRGIRTCGAKTSPCCNWPPKWAIRPGTSCSAIVEIALDLCGAGSAGLSIVEHRDGKERFRWHAVAGLLRDNLWSIAPQAESPSAITVARNAVQLFVRPDRHFRSMAEVKPPILELLIAPFPVDGRPDGTIWVVAHDRARQFDAEDARLLAT